MLDHAADLGLIIHHEDARALEQSLLIGVPGHVRLLVHVHGDRNVALHAIEDALLLEQLRELQRQQFGIERLHEVLGERFALGLEPILTIGGARHDHDREQLEARLLTKLVQELMPVRIRQVHIQQHRVTGRVSQRDARLGGGPHPGGLASEHPQHAERHHEHIALIVDDEDARALE